MEQTSFFSKERLYFRKESADRLTAEQRGKALASIESLLASNDARFSEVLIEVQRSSERQTWQSERENRYASTGEATINPPEHVQHEWSLDGHSPHARAGA